MALHVFVSSACYELRDLRASIKQWLTQRGVEPYLSDDPGFPNTDSMPPYASCLLTLERCPLVIGVVDRHYGAKFADWGDAYADYSGCSPTHAELRHAFKLRKQVLLYVHNDTWNFYEVWRKNRDAFKTSAPSGLDVATLEMFHEFKKMVPAPWMQRFSDVNDIWESLNKEFVNRLYEHFEDREKQVRDVTAYLLKKIFEAPQEVREQIARELKINLRKSALRKAEIAEAGKLITAVAMNLALPGLGNVISIIGPLIAAAEERRRKKGNSDE